MQSSHPDVRSAIKVLEDTLLSFPEGSNSHLDTMEEMANLHVVQFESPSHSSANLDEAIDLWREICRLCVPSSHRHLLALYQLSTLLQRRCFPTRLLQGLIHDRSPKTSNPNRDDLDEAILTQRGALLICSPDHELRLSLLGQLGSSLLQSIDTLAALQESARLLRSALSLCPDHDKHRFPLLDNLSSALATLVGASERHSVEAEVEELVRIHQEIADHHSPTAENRIGSLIETGKWLRRLCEPPLRRVNRAKCIHDLAQEILQLSPENSEARELLAIVEVVEEQGSHHHDTSIQRLTHEHHLARVTTISSPTVIRLLNKLQFRKKSTLQPLYYKASNDGVFKSGEVDTEIRKNLYCLCRNQSGEGQNVRLAYLNLGALFQRRYLDGNDICDLNAAIEYQEEARRFLDPQDDFYSILRSDIQNSLRRRYAINGDIEDYKRRYKLALEECQSTVPLIGPTLLPSPMVENLVAPTRTLATRQENWETLIQYHEEARTPHSLGRLAEHIFSRFTESHSEDLADLTKVLGLINEIEQADSPVPKSTSSLRSRVFLCWYRRSGELPYLNNAISLAATQGYTTTHMEALYERYIHEGSSLDLDKAIALGMVLHHPDNQPTGGYYVSPLGLCLSTRYSRTGNVDDLEESFRHSDSIDLAEAYMHRYERFGRLEDLECVFQAGGLSRGDGKGYTGDGEESTTSDYNMDDSNFWSTRKSILHCQALLTMHELQADPNLVLFAKSIITTAETHCSYTLRPYLLHCRVRIIVAEMGESDSGLQSAIAAVEEAISILPKNYVHRPLFLASLGDLLCRRYRSTSQQADLIASIEATRGALSQVVPSNPRWAAYSFALGMSLELYSKTGNAEASPMMDAIFALRDAAFAPSASLQIRYIAAINWAKAAAMSADPDALYAYNIVMEVLPQFASLGLDVRDRHRTLVRMMSDIVSDAAACAISYGSVEKAVEFLERGRSVFWRQATQLRSPMGTLLDAAPDLANRLAELARDLNISGLRTRGPGDSKARLAFLAREGPKRRALADEWEMLVEKARSVEGFENFLRPPRYTQLAKAAADSTVVMLSATAETCHAIILDSKVSTPRYLTLPLMTKPRVVELSSRLQTTLNRANRQSRRVAKMVLPFQAKSEETAFACLLAILWTDIVKPVLDFIGLQKSTCPPRLTWFCTGALALLPIHAAGIYTGPENVGISDFVTPSYTPTLSHLLSPAQTSADQVKLLLVSHSPGHAPIPNVSLELRHIQAVIGTTTTNTICIQLEDEDATYNNVLAKMASSHITHLACHGTVSRDPLDNGVVLHDGNLKVDTLMRTSLVDARLIFLSACQTAQINPSEPDEFIHIAAAMLFAGFKGAIATMWAINDNDGPQIAKSFYQGIIKGGTVDFSHAAASLHRAVREGRESGMSPLRWAPFIHVGL